MALLPFLHSLFECARAIVDLFRADALAIQFLVQFAQMRADVLVGALHFAHVLLCTLALLGVQALHELLVFPLHFLKLFADLIPLAARIIGIEFAALRARHLASLFADAVRRRCARAVLIALLVGGLDSSVCAIAVKIAIAILVPVHGSLALTLLLALALSCALTLPGLSAWTTLRRGRAGAQK